MPNKKNRNKRNGYFNNNGGDNDHRYKHHSGGGVHKQGGYGRDNFSRKVYFKPSILDAIDDENLQNRISDNRGGPDESRRGNKNNKKRFDKLTEMGVAKGKKLVIGEDDKDTAQKMLPSQVHSQVSGCPKEVFDMIVGYVQNYFSCFDTNREGLLGAYHQKCTFSLCLNMSNSVAHRSFRFEENVTRENRNLKRIVGSEDYHDEKRTKLMHTGYIDVLSLLCKMPQTEHDPRSFKLDVNYFSPTMITFNLAGVFKEGKPTDKVRPMRSFHRAFVCIPDPKSQMCIINEHYVISNVTGAQYKTYYSETQASNSLKPTEPQTSNQTVISESVAPIQIVPNSLNDQQMLMIQQFSTESRLNFEWSKHCLEHAKWNFQEAAAVFFQFKESLPKDAFIEQK